MHTIKHIITIITIMLLLNEQTITYHYWTTVIKQLHIEILVLKVRPAAQAERVGGPSRSNTNN